MSLRRIHDINVRRTSLRLIACVVCILVSYRVLCPRDPFKGDPSIVERSLDLKLQIVRFFDQVCVLNWLAYMAVRKWDLGEFYEAGSPSTVLHPF
jgi:hypothetical protein